MMEKIARMNEKAIIFGYNVISLPMIRSLGRKGISVIVVDYSRYAISIASKYVHESVIAPNPKVSSERFISFLMGKSTEWENSILIPSSDYDVVMLSQNKSKLSKYYTVTVPEWEVTEKCINKKVTHGTAQKANIPTPKTFFPNSMDDLIEYKDEIEYPCILKPLISHEFQKFSGTKVYKIKNFEDLKSKFMLANEHGCNMMVQEIIPGTDDKLYTYYSYSNLENRILAEFTCRKLRQTPPSFGRVTVGESTYTPELINLGRKFLKELSYTGLCGIEFKKDFRDNKFKLMEINARGGVLLDLPVKCGVDFPWIMYKDLMDHEKIEVNKYDTDLKWIYLIEDLVTFLKYRRREGWKFKDYINTYTGRKTFGIYDRNDLKPFIKECISLLFLRLPHYISKK